MRSYTNHSVTIHTNVFLSFFFFTIKKKGGKESAYKQSLRENLKKEREHFRQKKKRKKRNFESNSPLSINLSSYHSITSRKAKNSQHELIIVDLDPSIMIGIQLLEGLGKLFDDNTSSDKSVKRDSSTSTYSSACSFDIYPVRG